MALPDLDPARAPEQLAADILTYIDQAEQLVLAREPVLLAGLDDTIDALCKRVLALEPDQARDFPAQLEHIILRLDALKHSMDSLKGEVATTLKSLNTRQKAVRAYHKPENES